MALTKLNRNDQAIVAFDKALELDPSNADAWHGKAIALEKLDRTTEANASLEEARKLRYAD
jgi:Flp pilus assembly protein TadD